MKSKTLLNKYLILTKYLILIITVLLPGWEHPSPGFITEKSGNIRPGSDKHPPFQENHRLNGKRRRCYDFNVTLKKLN